MKNIKIISLLIVATLFLLVSCDNDDNFVAKPTEISPEFASVLLAKGFTVENGMLVVDEMVKDTKVLDLSRSHITKIPKGLEVFPNLEFVNFANNDFNVSFDFSQLPANIKGVDLSNNKIYEFKGLANIDFVNKKTEIVRVFDKLILPYSAKYNVETLPLYYKANKGIDMQMQEKDGSLRKYNTLREIPDVILRVYLKKHFETRFKGNMLDIASHFSLEEESNTINLDVAGGFWGDPDLEGAKFKSLEGIEYFLSDSRWKGEFSRMNSNLGESVPFNLGYVKLGKQVKRFQVEAITFDYLDISAAAALNTITLKGDLNVKKIDLSTTKIAGRGAEGCTNFFSGTPDNINIIDCPELEEVVLPDFSKMEKKPAALTTVIFANLPKLKGTIDLSGLQVIFGFTFNGVSKDLFVKFPEKLAYLADEQAGKAKKGKGIMTINVDENTKENKSIKDYATKHKMKFVEKKDWRGNVEGFMYSFKEETMGEWID